MKKLFFFAFIFGVIAAFGYSYWKTNKVTIAPATKKSVEKKSTFSIEEPPKNSIKGKLESYSGSFKWESRTATAPAEITIAPKIIQQGEVIETGKDSQVLVSFPDIGSVEISADTNISFTQLLPDNFVFNQSKGTVTYTKNSTTPFSVRALHLLVVMTDGKMTLEIDKETGKITVDMEKGSAKVGFNDIDYNSITDTIKEGEKFIFDDETREYSTE